MKINYAPNSSNLLTFHDKIPAFLNGSDTPRHYLERCLETLSEREPHIRAFVTLSLERARITADHSSKRYQDGRPLSPLDGMPYALKDVFETEDMPMQLGSRLFEGYETGWDSACAYFLRRGGAVLVGKTVLTEFAFGEPGPTRNAWDTERTPGGSSSGSGAAVGASMVAMAIGTQVRGSVLRPACFNGTWALKPSFGSMNLGGGFPSPPSVAHLGILGGSLADTWVSACWLSQNAGGAPGHPSLRGVTSLPTAQKPKRLARLDTPGWDQTSGETRAIFDEMILKLKRTGVEILDRTDDPELEQYEQDLVELRKTMEVILTFEGRWPLMMYADRSPELIGPRVLDRAHAADDVTRDQYENALKWSEGARLRHEALASKYDGFVTLNSIGPAPRGLPVGNTVYGEQSSVLGIPALNMPLLAQDGMPLGVQLLGYFRRDVEIVAMAHWILHSMSQKESQE
jgi:Asp-tRNA(Asn)/Glu-tRNA(Gln) amidotransferase A subunit family amidase